MMAWYKDRSTRRKTLSFLLIWHLFLMIAPKYFSFVFLNLYMPMIYPLMIIIFLTIQLHHPHINFLFELRKKYRPILLKQMVSLMYHMMMYVILMMLSHLIVITYYQMTYSLTSLIMSQVSTLFIYSLYHPLMTPLYYRVLYFVLFFLSHHFLLDLTFYETITFLYLDAPNTQQILIVFISLIILQINHMLFIEKKVL